jgi:hypothetical protein
MSDNRIYIGMSVKWDIERGYLLQSTKMAPSQILRYRTAAAAIFPFMVSQLSSESMQKMDERPDCKRLVNNVYNRSFPSLS